jgi:micrococcal nuclease
VPGGYRGPSLGVIVLLVIAIGVLLFGGDDGEEAASPDGKRSRDGGTRPPGVAARVTRVVDGDTVEVTVGGATEDVRYIGIDTPESVAPGQPVECFGHRASEFNRRLVEGRFVRLVFDTERRDQYGRLLAYVYLEDELVNATIVRRGYARTLTIAPNDRFAGLFARLEQRAGNAGRGLWDTC